MIQTRRPRGVRVTEDGYQKLLQAKAAKTQSVKSKENKTFSFERIAEEALCADKTVRSFFKGEPVDWDNAKAIAQVLGLSVEEVVDRPQCHQQPDPNLIDWHRVCRARLEAQKQWLTNPLTKLNRYVPLELVERQKPPQQASPTAEVQHQGAIADDNFFNEVLTQKQRLAIVGEPGSGKTSLILRIAEWILEKEAGIPIWISAGAIATQRLEQYLLEDWLKNAAGELEAAPPNWKQAFSELLKSGKVWLLLDGVDEMSVDSPLPNINQQLSEGWASNVRVVLTCRLNLWQADNNPLVNYFDVYHNLSLDYPAQVQEFITNWFADNPNLGTRLQRELEQPHREPIRDLVKNPLLLALLCRIWQNLQGNLPQTKAELYQRFVQQFYNWNDKFTLNDAQQAQLNHGLGQLAIDAIANGGERFLLPETTIRQVLKPDLFNLTLNLGWLNLVDASTTSETTPDKKVYAFLHPTFAEYYAAQAIDDWQFLFNNIPLRGERNYRILYPQWKEVILFWLGRNNVANEQKEAFINTLVKFEDSSNYEKPQALFLAPEISEFPEYTHINKIITQLIKYAFGYFDEGSHEWRKFDERVANQAAILLQTSCRISAIEIVILTTLEKLLYCPGWYKHLRQREAEYLSKICYRHQGAIQAFTHIIRQERDEKNRYWATYTLSKIDSGNVEIIPALTSIIYNAYSEKNRCKAACYLAEIATENSTKKYQAIQALIKFLATTTDDEVCSWSAEGLGKNAVDNPEAIATLTALLISTTRSVNLSWVAYSLGKIDPGNLPAIKCLIKQLSQGKKIRSLAEFCLKKVAVANTDSINALIEFIETTEEADACWIAAEILAKIEPGNSTAINTLIKLLLDADDIDNLHWQLKSFIKIAYNDTSAINILTDNIKNSQNAKHRHMAILCLKKIAHDHPATIIPVSGFQEFSHDLKSGFNLFMQNLKAVQRLPDESAVQVNEIIDLGTIKFIAENFDAALSSFLEALQIDPRNSYNRLQMVKLYRAKSLDVQAVAMAGFALSLTEETRRRSQLYNIIGRISQEQFERTKYVAYAEQAISAYQSAIESRSDDIVPRWNLVDIYLGLSKSDGGGANKYQQYVALAQTELLELRKICFSHQGNYRRYLSEVVKDASRVLAGLPAWWQEQLDDLRNLAEQMED